MDAGVVEGEKVASVVTRNVILSKVADGRLRTRSPSCFVPN